MEREKNNINVILLNEGVLTHSFLDRWIGRCVCVCVCMCVCVRTHASYLLSRRLRRAES